MEKIEEAKRIMETGSLDTKLQREIVAREICQLFEPKPDEGGLLRDVEMEIAFVGELASYEKGKAIAKAQRDLTTSIFQAKCEACLAQKNDECQVRVERIIKEIENNLANIGYPLTSCHDFREWINNFKWWQALKKQERNNGKKSY